MALFLTGIRDAIALFQDNHVNELDESLQAAHEVLRSSALAPGGLGWRKASEAKAPGAASTAARTELEQHGIQLSDSQLDRLLKLNDANDKRELARRRFFMQVTISLIVLAFAIGVLSLGSPSAAMEKTLFTLLGTVVGYWLR